MSSNPAAKAKAKGKGKGNGKKKTSLNDLKSEIKTDVHTVELDVLLRRLESDPERGLSRAEATARLVRDGKNALKPLKKTPEIVKFARNTFQGFGLLMWIGGLLLLISFIIIMYQNQVLLCFFGYFLLQFKYFDQIS